MDVSLFAQPTDHTGTQFCSLSRVAAKGIHGEILPEVQDSSMRSEQSGLKTKSSSWKNVRIGPPDDPKASYLAKLLYLRSQEER